MGLLRTRERSRTSIPVNAFPTPPGSLLVTAQSIGSLRSDASGAVGFSFGTPASVNYTVTALGMWRVAGNANPATHIYLAADNAGALTILATAVIDMSKGPINAYRWAAISSVTLPANLQYAIMREVVTGGDQWADQAAITGDATIGTPIFAVYYLGAVPPTTAGNSAGGNSYGPVNMLVLRS